MAIGRQYSECLLSGPTPNITQSDTETVNNAVTPSGPYGGIAVTTDRNPAYWRHMLNGVPIPPEPEIRRIAALPELAMAVEPERWQAELDRVLPPGFRSRRRQSYAAMLSAYRLLHNRAPKSLTEVELADAAGCSKTTARGAMLELERHGLLIVRRPALTRGMGGLPRNLPNTAWIASGAAPLSARIVTSAAIYGLLVRAGHTPRWIVARLRGGVTRAVELRGIISSALKRLARPPCGQKKTLRQFVFRIAPSTAPPELDPSEKKDSREGGYMYMGGEAPTDDAAAARKLVSDVAESAYAAWEARRSRPGRRIRGGRRADLFPDRGADPPPTPPNGGILAAGWGDVGL